MPENTRGKRNADSSLVQPLIATAHAERAVVVHRALEFDGEVLVRSEVVDDPAAHGAEDHRCIERPDAPLHPEAARERHRLAAEAVDVGIVGDRERDVRAAAREQHPPSRSEDEERQCPPRSAPDLVHHPVAELAHAVRRREPEAPLQFGMESGEIVAERRLEDRRHGKAPTSGCRSGASRSGVRPDGRPRRVARAMADRATNPALSETGLNARAQTRRSLTIAAAASTGIATIVVTNGQRCADEHGGGDAHGDLGNPGDAHEGSRRRAAHSQRPPEDLLGSVRHQQLGNQSVVDPCAGDAGDGGGMGDREVSRHLRWCAVLQPDAQPVEAPRRRPSEQRAEQPAGRSAHRERPSRGR